MENIRKEKKKRKKSASAGTEETGAETDSSAARLALLDILDRLSCMYRDLLLERAGVKRIFEEKYGIAPAQVKNYGLPEIAAILRHIETGKSDLMANANMNALFSGLFFNIRKEGLAA
ncbi:MAG TPA: hypothetical protein P5511_05490, partial [Candidatus Goldiibacteriota bacterium]|nr:hypothetical protein [Candidatus Goldiibacteriota bacterium]